MAKVEADFHFQYTVASGAAEARALQASTEPRAPALETGAAALRARCISAAALGAQQLDAWRGLQATAPTFDSAFFSPEFVAALAAERPGVEVIVVEREGRPVAFLPFLRGGRSRAHPVAGPLSDFEGLIAPPELALDLRSLLRDCGLSAWLFQHALGDPEFLAPFSVSCAESPFVDLSGGFDAYVRRRNELGGRELKNALRKARKIRSEVGPLRLVPNEAEPRLLDLLLEWKAAQIRERALPDPLADAWIPRFLRRVATLRAESCTGMLTALYVGDEIAALSFGVRSRHVLHGWITAYAPQFSRYSPGALLLVELARAGQGFGIERIDMGPGREPYKWRFHTGVRRVALGAVHTSPALQSAIQAGLRLREWAKSAPLTNALRKLVARSTRST